MDHKPNRGAIFKIGLGVWDKKDVADLAPDTDGLLWVSQIQREHIVVEEHKDRKLRWCHGNPRGFIHGTTETTAWCTVRSYLKNLFMILSGSGNPAAMDYV